MLTSEGPSPVLTLWLASLPRLLWSVGFTLPATTAMLMDVLHVIASRALVRASYIVLGLPISLEHRLHAAS